MVQVFRELRSGVTGDGRTTLKVPTGTLSTAEAISVLTSGMTLAVHFGDGELNAADVAAGLVGAVVKDPVQDGVAWNEYLEAVVKEREDWHDLYRACRDLTVAAGMTDDLSSASGTTGLARPGRCGPRWPRSTPM